jgi:hypothetical protein
VDSVGYGVGIDISVVLIPPAYLFLVLSVADAC